MVTGLETFREYFQNFTDDYVLIGGVAAVPYGFGDLKVGAREGLLDGAVSLVERGMAADDRGLGAVNAAEMIDVLVAVCAVEIAFIFCMSIIPKLCIEWDVLSKFIIVPWSWLAAFWAPVTCS